MDLSMEDFADQTKMVIDSATDKMSSIDEVLEEDELSFQQPEDLIYSTKIKDSNLEITVAAIISDDDTQMSYLTNLVKTHLRELTQGKGSIMPGASMSQTPGSQSVKSK